MTLLRRRGNGGLGDGGLVTREMRTQAEINANWGAADQQLPAATIWWNGIKNKLSHFVNTARAVVLQSGRMTTGPAPAQ